MILSTFWLVQVFMCDDGGSVNTKTVKHYKGFLPCLHKHYKLKNIFNADERGFFYAHIPNKTKGIRGGVCHSGKDAKNTSQFYSAQIQKPLVIGKTAKTRSFKNVHVFSVPCKYVISNMAWIN
jgi:hypothetical protein